MPTLLRVGPFRLFIVLFDCHERMHVHVTGGGAGECKVWLEPEVGVAAVKGYTSREVARILAIVRDHRDTLIQRWIDECEGGVA